jgi:hypothetical protein
MIDHYNRYEFLMNKLIKVRFEDGVYKSKKNEKKRLQNIRRRIFYHLQTSADTKKHQKASADENLTN